MKVIALFFLLVLSSSGYSQEAYNNCNMALDICPNTTVTVNNIGSNKTFCPNCEDDFNQCFTPTNTIWLKFSTNDTGGNIQISLSNLQFIAEAGRDNRFNAALIETATPCIGNGYTTIGNCIAQQSTDQVINAAGLAPATVYYLVLSGELSGAGITLPAEFTLDVSITGPAIDRLVPVLNAGIASTLCANTLNAAYAERINCEDPGDFNWFVNNVHVATTSDSVYYSDNLQTGDIVSVQSSCYTSCPVTLSLVLNPVTVTTLICDAGPDEFIKQNEVVQLHAAIGVNTVATWSPSYALSATDITSPVANPAQTTTYTLLVEDTISGCTAVDYITVHVESGLFIPNTFSPNGDGENDTWVLLGIEAYPDCLLNIYNRWGQHIFQSTGYNLEKAWDGKGKLGDLNEGVYFYELQLRDSEKQVLKGSITLIR